MTKTITIYVKVGERLCFDASSTTIRKSKILDGFIDVINSKDGSLSETINTKSISRIEW